MCVFGEADLIAVDHKVVCGDERFEHDHPAGVGGALEQSVSQLRDVDIHLVGALDQIWWERVEGGQCVNNSNCQSVCICTLITETILAC